MKRTFVFLLTVLTQAPFSYAQTDISALDKKIPALQSTLSQQSDTLPADQTQKPDLLLHAQLKARQNILLASEMSGRIQNLAVRDGERFTTGQVLATISCPKAKSQLIKVHTELNKQEQVIQQLEDMHSINTLEIDLANSERDEAKANVMVTEALLSRCIVYAPFSGKVVKRFAKPSQIVRVGDPLLEIMDSNSQEVEFLVPANEMSHIELGKHYQVNLEDASKSYHIELTGLGGRIDSETQTIKIYGRIENTVTAALSSAESVVALRNVND